MKKARLISILLAVLVSAADADLALKVNGLDASNSIEIEPNAAIIISVSGANDTNESYTVACEEGGTLNVYQGPNVPPEQAGYLLIIEDEMPALPIVNLTVAGKLDYQLAFFIIPDANVVVFGIDSDAIEIPEPETEAELSSAEVDSTESIATESTQESAMEGSESEGGMALAMAGYDLVLSGVNKYTTPRSYSNQSIIITEDGFVAFDNVYFENCTVDVNGFIELNSDVNLVDSIINVIGGLKAKAGIVITETGASSIIASGDSLNAGRITLEGKFANPIRVYSDYAATDTEFIIIESESSSNSTIKWVDFFGGWTNVQIYDKRLTDGISNCRFFAPNYAVYQNGVDELTDVRFCFFYWNTISVYLGIDDCYANEVEFLLDNVVIDNNFEDPSYGIVLSGYLSVPDYSTLRISNSIITNSYCGWFIDGSSFYPPVMSNLAYYGNYYDDNLSSSGFQKNPMYLPQSPFVTPSDPNGWPYFIDTNSAVADVNIGDLWQSAPQQLLTSIYEDGTPRGNKGIGFGMPIPLSYATKAGELACDILSDGIVNFKDFAEFAADWGFNGISPADFDEDGKVDVNDLDILSQDWLQTSQIDLNVVENGNYFNVECPVVSDLNLSDCAFFLDGEYIASRYPIDNPTLIIDKRKCQNGSHELKAVVKGNNCKPYVTAAENLLFDAPLNGIEYQKIFDPCNYFVVKGDVANGYTATISIKDTDNTILWSSDFSDDFITLVDPNSFSDDEINYNVTYSTGGSSGSGSALSLGGKPTNKTAMLIICMVEDGMTEGGSIEDTGTCRYAAKMAKLKNVAVILLRGYGGYNEVNNEMFNKVFRKYRKIRYLHINAHGDYEWDGAGFFGFNVLRTSFLFNDGRWPSYNSRVWTDQGSEVPEHYEWLCDDLENRACLAQLPFKQDQLRISVIEPCYGLRNLATKDAEWVLDYQEDAIEYEEDHHLPGHPDYPYSDICFSFKIQTNKQMALGSSSFVFKNFYPHYKRFFNAFWYGLGNESLNTHDALNDWAIPVASIEVKNHFKVRGIVSTIDNVYLTSNPD